MAGKQEWFRGEPMTTTPTERRKLWKQQQREHCLSCICLVFLLARVCSSVFLVDLWRILPPIFFPVDWGGILSVWGG
jgi:hypothetical protein